MLLRTQSNVCYKFFISGNTTSAVNSHSAEYIMKENISSSQIVPKLDCSSSL